jgi:hypothetical protein
MKLGVVCLAIWLTFLVAPINAQNPTRLVYVSVNEQPNAYEKQVVSAVKTRILATTRYRLGDATNAELEVTVLCMDLATATTNIQGAVCTFIMHYWPNELTGLSCAIGVPVLLSGTEPSNIGEQIFAAMVNASTEQELAKRLGTMRTALALIENSNQTKH